MEIPDQNKSIFEQQTFVSTPYWFILLCWQALLLTFRPGRIACIFKIHLKALQGVNTLSECVVVVFRSIVKLAPRARTSPPQRTAAQS